MLLCLICTYWLRSEPIFLWTFWAQIAVYSLAIMSCLIPALRFNKVMTLLTYWFAGHTANVIGSWRYLLGFENNRWKKINN